MSDTNTATPPVPGSPEHNAAMIALARSRGATAVHSDDPGAPAANRSAPDPANTQKPEGAPKVDDKGTAPGVVQPVPKPATERPSWCPEKFWNAETGTVNQEGLAKSYAELERSRTKQPEAPKASPLADAVKAAEAELAAATDDAAKAAAQAKVDGAKKALEDHALSVVPAELLKKANDEFAADGKLSDESYAELAKRGFGREYVDAYVDGQRATSELQTARAELYTLKVHTAVGGAEEYTKLATWASTGYTAEQKAAFDSAVTSGDLTKALAAVQSLKQAFTASNGSPPARRSEGDNAAGAVPEAYFKNKSEMTAAMADPRYRTDEVFRQEVAKKIAGSQQLNIRLR